MSGTYYDLYQVVWTVVCVPPVGTCVRDLTRDTRNTAVWHRLGSRFGQSHSSEHLKRGTWVQSTVEDTWIQGPTRDFGILGPVRITVVRGRSWMLGSEVRSGTPGNQGTVEVVVRLRSDTFWVSSPDEVIRVSIPSDVICGRGPTWDTYFRGFGRKVWVRSGLLQF